MSSKSEICNMAIAHVGIGKSVVDIDTDRTAEADALRKFYDQSRDATLRDANWPFATKIAALAVSALSTAPDGWTYCYTYPSDCLRIRKLRESTRRVDSSDNAYPYQVLRGTGEKIICTDQGSAYLEYTYAATSEDTFDEDFAIALSYRLAMYIAPRLTGGSYGNIFKNLGAMYSYHIAVAKQNAANEAGPDTEPDSEFLRARE